MVENTTDQGAGQFKEEFVIVSAKPKEEWRIDTADGLAYTKEDFVAEYGDLKKWNTAQPVSLQP